VLSASACADTSWRTYVDVVELAPAVAEVADMLVDHPGTWLLHCHVADHMMAGMYATYAVTPAIQTARR